MNLLPLAITTVSLIVALVMSVKAWRVTRDEKKRSAARVAALSLAADAVLSPIAEAQDPPLPRAPWSAPRIVPAPVVVSAAAPAVELPLNQPARVPNVPRVEPREIPVETTLTHATGFLGAAEAPREDGHRQRSLAFAAVVLFLVLSGGLAWMMSGPRGTTAAAMGPNAPLELVSLSHERQNNKLAISGLVRNPVGAKPIERLSAVVFLFDRMGTFVTSSRANVDFLKLGAGDESPFVVSLDAPPTVARYRVSFRTDDGIVPHVDRRSASAATGEGEQTVNVRLK